MLPQSGYYRFPHTAHIYGKQPQSHVIGRYYNVFQYHVTYEPLRKYRCLLHEFRLAVELLISGVSYIPPSGVLLSFITCTSSIRSYFAVMITERGHMWEMSS